MNTENKTALITGAASGLGEATARALAQKNANVVLVDRDEARGKELAASLGEHAVFHPGDVTDEAALEAAVQLAKTRFGGLHMAVCCAGIGTAKKVLGRDGPMPLALFAQTIQVNLIGTFNTVRLAVAAMAENNPDAEGERGVVVMTASVAAYEGQIGQAAYSASKGGVISMTLPMARELAAHGIRVMTIAPGLFDTPMMAGFTPEVREALGQQVPFPSRLGHPAEYARQVCHIMETPMLNGSVIRLDGALRMTAK